MASHGGCRSTGNLGILSFYFEIHTERNKNFTVFVPNSRMCILNASYFSLPWIELAAATSGDSMLSSD